MPPLHVRHRLKLSVPKKKEGAGHEKLFCTEVVVGTTDGAAETRVARYSCWHKFHHKAWAKQYETALKNISDISCVCVVSFFLKTYVIGKVKLDQFR
jgi:hypothetical protein